MPSSRYPFTLPMPLPVARNAHIWLPGYLRARFRNSRAVGAGFPVHVLFCIADHFEPGHGRPSVQQEHDRVARWATDYVAVASQFRDSSGRPPQHTFFFPVEEYRPAHVDALAAICQQGFGEVEVHLHQGHDTSAALRARLEGAISTLAERHGLLGRHPDGRVAYGFVHGNWALDNGGPDASFCGVNDELTILRETGCYADFTMPACPDVAQSRVVNAIYHVRDDPSTPRSYDRGRHAQVGYSSEPDELLLIEGPLSLWWPWPQPRVLPRIDSGTIDATPGNWPTVDRFARWVNCNITVAGRPDWIFVKVHTHGASERNADVLLGSIMREFHRLVGKRFNDGDRYRLHYVTAREMFNIVEAALAGKTGDPSQYRDFRIRRITEAVRRYLP
jgi:hypothetical protein